MIWPLTMAGRVMFVGDSACFVLQLVAEAGPLGQIPAAGGGLAACLDVLRQLIDAEHQRIAQPPGVPSRNSRRPGAASAAIVIRKMALSAMAGLVRRPKNSASFCRISIDLL